MRKLSWLISLMITSHYSSSSLFPHLTQHSGHSGLSPLSSVHSLWLLSPNSPLRNLDTNNPKICWFLTKIIALCRNFQTRLRNQNKFLINRNISLREGIRIERVKKINSVFSSTTFPPRPLPVKSTFITILCIFFSETFPQEIIILELKSFPILCVFIEWCLLCKHHNRKTEQWRFLQLHW